MSNKYQFNKVLYKLNDYEFYDDTEDSSNDYSRLLETFKKGAFIISACRSKFEKDTIENIKSQLDNYKVPYTQEELNSLERSNCDSTSGIYKHLIDRYNATTTKSLENDLRNMGYGFRASYGGYQENINSVPTREMSFIVPYISSKTEEQFKNDLVYLVDKYIQDSGLIVLPNLNDGKPFYITNKSEKAFEFQQKLPSFKKPEDQYFTETKKTNSKAFIFKDSKLSIEDLAKEFSRAKLIQ